MDRIGRDETSLRKIRKFALEMFKASNPSMKYLEHRDMLSDRSQKRLDTAIVQALENSGTEDVEIEIDAFCGGKDLAVTIPKGVLDSFVTVRKKTQMEQRREDLIAFYEKHDSTKIAIVDALLMNEFGELCDAIFMKYGELPDGEDWVEHCSAAEEVGEEEVEPEKEDIEEEKIEEEEKVDVFERRRRELVRFYETHDPSKISIVEGLLRNEFADLCNAIMKKYGHVPGPEWERYCNDNTVISRKKEEEEETKRETIESTQPKKSKLTTYYSRSFFDPTSSEWQIGQNDGRPFYMNLRTSCSVTL